MNRYEQRPPDGCLQACVAGLLECDLDALPQFFASDWFEGWNRALEPLGWWLLSLDVDDGDFPPGLWIAIVPSLNNEKGNHAVIARGHRLEWDPAIGRKYVELPEAVLSALLLFPLDPARS